MKKEKKREQKPREFHNVPFSALRELKTALPETKAEPLKAPPPPPPAKQEEPDDFELFLRAVEDVRRIGAAEASAASRSGRVKRFEPPPPAKLDQEDEKLFLNAMEGMRVRFSDSIPEEFPEQPRAANRLRQLRRGAIRIDYELDLHGLTRDEALESLNRFISGAYNRGQKAVLVITGKGNNSPGEPVLQGAVACWLRETGKGTVAEFAPAPREMGGSGAFVVFLKEKKE